MARSLLLITLLGLSPTANAFELWGMGPLANASVQITADSEFRYHRSSTEDPGRKVDGPYVMFPGLPVDDYVEQVG